MLILSDWMKQPILFHLQWRCGKADRQGRFDLMELRCYRSLKNTKRLERSLGTLGGTEGNIMRKTGDNDTGGLMLFLDLPRRRPFTTGSRMSASA